MADHADNGERPRVLLRVDSRHVRAAPLAQPRRGPAAVRGLRRSPSCCCGARWVGWTRPRDHGCPLRDQRLGVTLGFHRLLTHRSFQTHKPTEYALAILGSVAVQGPVMSWVADHRKHHAHTDKEGDPHSPHGHGSGVQGAVAGLWYAHMGWLFDRAGQAEHARYARELYEDRGMRVIHRRSRCGCCSGLAIPSASAT